MAKKRRIDVMVSSTTKDLAAHRKQVSEAILRTGMFPLAMEYDEAVAGKNALSYSLDLVDKAEVYVGIFGVRYGFEPPDTERNPDNLSITELEYRRAKERGIPILIFIMDMDNHHVPAAFTADETDAHRAKLKRLKSELQGDHIVSFFTSADNLHIKAYRSLVRLERDGLLPEDDDTPPAPEQAAPLPAPPDFYADPPYTLTSEFIGRTAELRQLDEWAQSDDPMMIVEAIGGMGKSAVTWEWVQRQLRNGHDFDGVMWWSFYESGATMDAFVRHALAYLTRADPDTLKGSGLRENFTKLRRELGKGRYLLVLDGLERALVAYHRWNAAQMRDDTVEEAEAIIKDRDIRACTDPRDGEVLRGLLACDRAKVLMSSRLLPLALEDRSGNLSRGVAHIHLNGLHPDDALALTRAAGVRVRDTRQFTGFVERFGGHSLLVKLVAGRVLKFRRARGDFDRWYAAEGRALTPADFDLKQQQTHILQYALAGLDETARHFLSQIAAFGDAVAYDTLAVFNPFARPAPEKVEEPNNWYEELMRDEADTEEEKQRWQAEIDENNAPYQAYQQAQAAYEAYRKSPEYHKALSQFDELLSELEERGLLRWEREKDIYDMHPVVRGTAFESLEGDSRAATFERIRGHLEARPTEDIEAAQTVADLTNTIAIYRALVGAGKWDEAARFFDNRLRGKLHYNIAAYYTVIELLTPLFADGTDALPRLRDPSLQSSITTTLAIMFYYIGRGDAALTLKGLTLKLNLDIDDSTNLIIGLQSYAISLDGADQLALAQRTREAALALAQATDNTNQIAMPTLSLLGSYTDIGQWQQAEAAYAALSANPPREAFWQSVVERFYAQTLIYRGLDASAALDKAEALAVQGRNALSLRQIKGWRGEVALAAGDHAAAIRWFEDYTRLSNEAGSSDVFVALGGLARAYALAGEHDRARAIIETTDFNDAEVVNAAEVYLTLADHDKAREYAIRGYQSAWADGPPYVWWWHLERAKAVLDALGEPYPALPPFDPAKIGQYPYQDEIEAHIEAKRQAREGDGE